MIESTLKAHLKRYPEMQLTDVYKLLHQASIGPTHAIRKRDNTLDWLGHETDLYPVNGDGTLLESITDDDARVRVHLRAYRALGGSPDTLVDALIADGGADASQTDLLASYWNTFVTMRHNFPASEVDLFGTTHARLNWCAVQHSPEYIEAYHPAYRVLSIAAARKICEDQGIPFQIK